MTPDDERTTAEKLEVIELELRRLRSEYDAYKQALVDPKLTTWVDGTGRVAPRALTSFELATVRHLDALRPKIAKLERAETFLFEKAVTELAGRPGDGTDDPETLLRAALRCLALAWKAGHKTTEARITIRALADYLKSLDEDESG